MGGPDACSQEEQGTILGSWGYFPEKPDEEWGDTALSSPWHRKEKLSCFQRDSGISNQLCSEWPGDIMTSRERLEPGHQALVLMGKYCSERVQGNLYPDSH